MMTIYLYKLLWGMPDNYITKYEASISPISAELGSSRTQLYNTKYEASSSPISTEL